MTLSVRFERLAALTVLTVVLEVALRDLILMAGTGAIMKFPVDN